MLRIQLRNVNKHQISEKDLFLIATKIICKRLLWKEKKAWTRKIGTCWKSLTFSLCSNSSQICLKARPGPFEESAPFQTWRTSRNCVTEISVVLWEIVTLKESKFSNFLPIDKAWLVPYGVFCALKWIGEKMVILVVVVKIKSLWLSKLKEALSFAPHMWSPPWSRRRMRPLSLAGPKIHRLNNNVMISSQGQEGTVDISAEADLKMTSLTRKNLVRNR